MIRSYLGLRKPGFRRHPAIASCFGVRLLAHASVQAMTYRAVRDPCIVDLVLFIVSVHCDIFGRTTAPRLQGPLFSPPKSTGHSGDQLATVVGSSGSVVSQGRSCTERGKEIPENRRLLICVRPDCSQEWFGRGRARSSQSRGHHVRDPPIPGPQRQYLPPAFPTSCMSRSAATSFGAQIDRGDDRHGIPERTHRERWPGQPGFRVDAVFALLPLIWVASASPLPVLSSRRGVQGVVGVPACQPAGQCGKKKKSRSMVPSSAPDARPEPPSQSCSISSPHGLS